MAPLRQICGATPRRGDQLIKEEVVLSVREQIRPLIAMARISIMANFAGCYFVGLFSFVCHFNGPFTLENMIPIAIWPLAMAASTNQDTSSCLTLFVVVETLSRILKTSYEQSMDRPEEEDQDETPSSSSDCADTRAKRTFLGLAAQQLSAVNSVRRYNRYLKPIIGWNLTFVMVLGTMTGLFLITNKINPTFLAVIPIAVFCLTSFAVMIVSLSQIPISITRIQVALSRMADQSKWSVEERCRINRTLEGMLHSNGFTAFDYSPQIHGMMVITVISNSARKRTIN